MNVRKITFLLMLLIGLGRAGAVELHWSFEYGAAGWQAHDCRIEPRSERIRYGRRTLAVHCEFPAVATLELALGDGGRLDVTETPHAGYSVFVPESAGSTVKTLLYLKNKDGLWYQAVRNLPLYPGRWTEVTFDLSPGSVEVEPVGHFRRWGNEVAAEISEIGIKFFSDRRGENTLYLDEVFFGEDVARGRREEPLSILNFRANSTRVPRFDKFELTFDLNRSFSNPFDDSVVAVDAEFEPPGGGDPVTMPGFYYQDYVRIERPLVRHVERRRERIEYHLLEDLVPVGAGHWKVRFAPTEVGTWRYRLRVLTDRGLDSQRELVTAWREFTCTPSDRPGYIRVAEDRWNFEFTTGEPFYPIGHNVHASNDTSTRNCDLLGIEPQDDRGLAAFADIFEKMSANGENVAEVWLASWTLAIEWTAEWPHYFGPGRYNLYNAWKIDRLLELARKNEVYIHLVLENHGKLSSFVDPEWNDHPYNERNWGGFLRSCKDFFSDRRARNLYRRKLRYIIARWGWSSHIMAFELVSELDLTGERFQDHNDRDFLAAKVSWHREMAQFIRASYHGKHMITTHYSGDYRRVQPEIAGLDELDYISLDAYRQRDTMNQTAARILERTVRQLSVHNKPIFVTEYGGTPRAASPERIHADLHTGLWSGYMTRMAGTPLLWWFMYIDRHDKYHHFRALAAFNEGEDRRGRDLEMHRPEVTGGQHLGSMALRDDHSGYAWVFDERSAIEMPRTPYRHSGARLTFGGFREGRYRIEFWDTYAGEPVGDVTVETDGSRLAVELPAFGNDIALKIEPAE